MTLRNYLNAIHFCEIFGPNYYIDDVHTREQIDYALETHPKI